MLKLFFLQMSGVPGSGKSTLARAIARKTGAVVIDHDVVKSAFLASSEEVVDTRSAGKIAYDIEWALLDSILSQGQSVILDSPCLYPVMIEKGRALATKHQVPYRYVECVLEDLKVVDQRLRTRERLISQNDHVASEVEFLASFGRSARPADGEYLLIDSGQPIEAYFDEVVEYVTRENGK